MRSEKEVRRYFAERGLDVFSIRRSKHWVVRAGRKGEEPGLFVIAVSASDHRAFKNLDSEIRRGGHRYA